MSLYGHTHINIDSLKRWVDALSMDGIQNIDIGGYNFEINDETKKQLELQLQSFSECIRQMKEGDDWRNYYFLDNLRQIDINNVNHNDLRKVLADYKKISTERDALRLVFMRSIDISKFKSWINSKSEYVSTYCNSPEYKIDITKADKKIISDLVARVYGYRCSIAHAKGDVEEYIAIPSISKEKISAEIPLVKYLAYEVIRSCSEV